MTNKKSTKRALLVSAMAMVICFTMLLGTTFAWFTDSEVSGNNVIKSGKLDVRFEYREESADSYADAASATIFDYDKWEPGYLVYRQIKLTNDGTLAFNYKLKLVANGPMKTNALGATLANVIDVYYQAGEHTPARAADGTVDMTDYEYAGTLASVFAKDSFVNDNLVNKNDTDTYTLVLVMKTGAGNEYQDLELGSTFTIQVLAAQMVSEEDDINNKYDIDADYEDGTPSV